MGETILGNRYEIIRKIGDGGMAFVYEAKDKLLNRTVAVKVLRPEFVDDDEFLAKFKREAEAVASLSHQNIVNVYDVGQDGKVHYIVMEYVEGQNLKEIIKNEGTLDEYTALDITKQIAMALSAAHRKGIIHRDIKPHNILISNDGRIVKVTDFGIAKAVSNSTMTNIGSIIGSVHYFSPEQAKGKFVSNNADLYSLGIVLYEMLIGKVPFRGDSPISIALQHINDEIEFTQDEKINIPQSVRTIIKKLTEKSATSRYQSAEELIEDIEYIERNIDLDFIKEYDNYATMKFDNTEINNSMKSKLSSRDINEKKEKEVNKDDIESNLKINDSRKQKDINKSNKKWKIAAIVLSSILGIYLIIGAFMLIGKSTNKAELVAPNLQTMSLDEAQREIEKLGLTSIVRDEYNPNVEKGYVISQTPLPGYDVKEGDTITIIISKGAKRADVPKIVGYTLEEAENILKENKLQLGNIKYEHSDMYKSGVVLRQSPESGSSSIEEGEKIDVVVSQGPEISAPSQVEEENSMLEEQPQVNTPSDENITENESSNLHNSDNSSNNENVNSDTESNSSGQGEDLQENPTSEETNDTSGNEEASGISDIELDNEIEE